MTSHVEIVQGDITTLQVDAIVNAANESLLGGGGVDGAIHHAAGPELLGECRTLNGCKTGEAKITKGYRLKAQWVIHTVGPVWRGGHHQEDELLASCYRNSLTLAEMHSAKTVAFPCISTGVYRFPKERAARISLTAIYHFLSTHQTFEKITVACFGNDDYQICQTAVDEFTIVDEHR